MNDRICFFVGFVFGLGVILTLGAFVCFCSGVEIGTGAAGVIMGISSIIGVFTGGFIGSTAVALGD